MTFIVGLAGPGKVGKSTTAKKFSNCIKTKHKDLKIDTYAFATPIYEMCSFITGWPIEQLKDLKYKEVDWTAETAPLPSLIGLSPRSLLQKVGTECFRNQIHTKFWIDLTISKTKHLDMVIIEDARFSNEYEICNLNIELYRDGIEYLKNHASAMPPEEHYVSKKIKIDSVDFSIDKETYYILEKYFAI